MGRSRLQNCSSATIEVISAPQPHSRGFSSTVNRFDVLAIDPQDGFRVQRYERANVDHFGVDAVAGQDFGGIEGSLDHKAEGDDRAVGAAPSDHRLAELVDDVAVGYFAFCGVERFVLEEQNWIGITDGGGGGVRRRRQVWMVRRLLGRGPPLPSFRPFWEC